MDAAGKASARTGLRGIHFVDEAMPMGSLLAFARANRARAASGKSPFHFWGNVRFDSSWTADRCEFLAASGLVAVSGGVEIATEKGLELTGKGFGLADLVGTLVAMRRAGLLVHAYLIYGFPGQSREDIVDSAEACRQLFASGLVDSAFWHRFVLTRHSGLYRAWLDARSGGRSDAFTRSFPPALESDDAFRDFASNDLRFAGEEAYDEFDGPLAASLEAWMRAEDLETPAAESLRRSGLSRARGSSAIWPSLIEGLVERAEAEIDSGRERVEGRAQWIAGALASQAAGGGFDRLSWAYRGEMRELRLPTGSGPEAKRILSAIAGEGRPMGELAQELALSSVGPAELECLRGSGLVVV